MEFSSAIAKFYLPFVVVNKAQTDFWGDASFGLETLVPNHMFLAHGKQANVLEKKNQAGQPEYFLIEGWEEMPK